MDEILGYPVRRVIKAAGSSATVECGSLDDYVLVTVQWPCGHAVELAKSQLEAAPVFCPICAAVRH